MPPSNPNVEIFNRVCLYLFSELYESFPVPMAIDPNALGLSAVPDEEEYDACWSVMEIAVETVTFLQQEGFVTVRDRVSTGEFGDVRLTMKGLAVLGVPISLKANEPREPIITKIKKLAEKGAEKVATETVQAVVSEVFKFALGSTTAVAGAMVT
jgi:hypothetical protein